MADRSSIGKVEKLIMGRGQVLLQRLLLLLIACIHVVSAIPYVPENFTNPGGDVVMNQIDMCWRWNPIWADDRQSLSDCAVGFGKWAKGGRDGELYVVEDTSDDPANPKPGTLRWGVIQEEPLWIVFDRDMSLELENELIVNSHKTIDGRGVEVEIGHGPCITIQGVTNVIIHGLKLHHCTPSKPGKVASSATDVGRRQGSDGDAIVIYESSDIWIDHCTFSNSADGLIDIIHASTAITVSNCHFSDHDKVMLLGHKDSFAADKIMKVTLVYNHFAPGLVQRMPRVRFGYVHVANNRYEKWQMYCIGGSRNPTIFSQGNHYYASDDSDAKEVTKREKNGGDKWKSWKWKSEQDYFLNDAFFVPSGHGSCSPDYSVDEDFVVMDGTMAPVLTSSAGVLDCRPGLPCVSF